MWMEGNWTQEKGTVPLECLLGALGLCVCETHLIFTTVSSLLGARNLGFRLSEAE